MTDKKVMKICDLTYAYSRGGGITTYINNKKTVYKKRGIEHLIISPRKDGGQEVTLTQDGSTRVYLVPGRKLKLDKVDNFFYHSFKSLEDILAKEKPDILEIGDSFTAAFYGKRLRRLSKSYGAKIFFFSHERLDNFYQQIFPRGIQKLFGLFATWFLGRKIIAIADAIIANSEFTAEEPRQKTKKPVLVLPLGIDLSGFSTAKDQNLCNQLSNNGKKKIIIHVGRLERDKKIDLLFDIAQSLDHDKYQLVVLGDGLWQKKFSQLPGVTVTGFLPPATVRRYLVLADLGILVNDIEPYGLVGLEMMAAGLPVLGPNQGGLPTFLRPEFAWLLPHQKQAYLEALKKWETMSEGQKQQLSQAALTEVKKYTLEKMVDQLLNIYQTYG